MNFVGDDCGVFLIFYILVKKKLLPLTESRTQLLNFYLVMCLCIDTFVEVKGTCVYASLTLHSYKIFKCLKNHVTF